MTKRSKLQELEDRVNALELKLSDHVRILQDRLTAAEAYSLATRKRLDSFYPERPQCPHCKAPVHRQATACGACGRSWGKVTDPLAGLPR